MRQSKGSLAGWLFADFALVLAVISLSSWNLSEEPPTVETVPAAKYKELLAENRRLEETILIREAEIKALKLLVKQLQDQIGADPLEGVKLEPITVTIKAQPSDSSDVIIGKIERELALADVDPALLFSFALIFGGTQEGPTEAMREDAKTRAKAIGDKLRNTETQSGWEKFNREQYVRPFHDIGLGYGFYKIELYPSN